MLLNRVILSRSTNIIHNSPRPFRSSLPTSSRVATACNSHPRRQASQSAESQDDTNSGGPPDAEEESALSRRFTEMTDEAMTSSPRKAAKITSENVLSEDLKRELEERIAKAQFNTTHAQALSVLDLPSGAPKQVRDIAAATPWTGTESIENAVLRMVVDTHKPPRGEPVRKPKPQTPGNVGPSPIRASKPQSASQRIAYAREKTTEYTLNKSDSLSEDEKSEVRNMFRERFMPEGRPVASLNAIASLADEKIEEARARGQFKNLPRGRPLERDHNADSPFLDTTEYFMNRIIQRQDIVPPWIEKQQDLAKAVRVFRERLRADWKRHVSRIISSAGGSIDEQCRRAEEYAAGEARLARIEDRAKKLERGEEVDPLDEDVTNRCSGTAVFRDPTWEKTELQYHKLAIGNLNSITRSYNLMAPELVKKPYFTLEREVKICFRDTAPLIPDVIRERAKISPQKVAEFQRGSNPGPLLEKFGASGNVVVYDSTKPNYGFKELFKDVFSGWKWGKQTT
ncbi:unnamed protein product [Tuber melanosporum]|uniref:(Perigord truffle) hypothetical protein n=1 Tax=Tuber melanosporum (strain Mel28) TaxID=656061 RepID=D5GG78_TUBMM|nr:uncharacterized protein GSTUM_00001990001 [Tuber melanosporum]CAZ83521.1 unnamed protein product [Tuber melanosporum]